MAITIRELLVLYMTPPPSHMPNTHTKQLNIQWFFWCFFWGSSFLHFGNAEEKEKNLV
jgi:hypothetical protein